MTADPLTRWRMTADLLRRLANAVGELLDDQDIEEAIPRVDVVKLAALLDEVHQELPES